MSNTSIVKPAPKPIILDFVLWHTGRKVLINPRDIMTVEDYVNKGPNAEHDGCVITLRSKASFFVRGTPAEIQGRINN